MSRVTRSNLLAAIVLLLGANAAHAKLASNKLASNKLAANKLAANKLATGGFAANPDGVSDLLATPDSRELLIYIVSCALPEGMTLVATAPDSTEYEFFGEIGLAKSWLRHPLNAAGRGWISACLLARVNNHDVANAISFRGPHRALATVPGEAENYTLEEGAFYGDVFATDDEGFACRGKDQAAGETGGLIDRDCAEPDPADPTHTQCGLLYAGDCGAFASVQACEQLSADGFYKSCHAQVIVAHQHSRKFRQVITVFVVP